ncbi:MAG: nucleoside triphosphate pyrophosphohydrolase [Alphaproteobacteria bacterium]|nr:nucleoside triphosphate pyrophosphohydrolase [Alphaproteobacteria bacterium]
MSTASKKPAATGAPAPQRPIDRLIAIMARLRDPKGGCPWDLEQDFTTIAPYTIEEAYEVADAIQRGDMTGLREELGDLLLQVVYHARMAEEAGNFAFDDVATAIADKMVARHPHVFGGAEIDSAAAQTRMWEEFKARERAAKASASRQAPSVLDDVPLALPALLRAEKLQKRAARVGFDWPEARQVLDKIEEEIREVRAELDQGAPAGRIGDEIGDLLFALANLARHLKIDPETALRGCNAKFERRFRSIEQELAKEGKTPTDASLDEMEALWVKAKRGEQIGD